MSLEDYLQQDTDNRQHALALDSFIVEAPAGAGKTELLTQRYLTLLKTVSAPEEIIAITFTNKAASEMRARIMESLEMAAAGVVPDKPHKLTTYHLGSVVLARSQALSWRLLETPSRLRIYTIDSLSGNLARQMPLLSRFGTQPAVTDDAKLFYEEAAMRALEHLNNDGSGEVVARALRYFDNDSYKLNALLVDMLGKRDQWLPYSKSQHTAQEAEQALSAMIAADLQAAAEALPSRLQAILKPVARYAASQLSCEEPIALLLDWEQDLRAQPQALAQWRAVVELLLTTKGELRQRVDKSIGLPATDEAKPFKQQLQEVINTLAQDKAAVRALACIKRLPNPQQDAETWQVVATLAQLLHLAVAELWLVFQAHGQVDFVEISDRAIQALQDTEGNVTDLALKLDYRIQHLLVDEFQDTSPSQIKLIHALTRGWQPSDGRTLFCVGDPMQSIYRFRKANVGLFLHVARHGIGDVKLKPLKLWRNNRSCPPVITWVNEAFARVFPAKDSVAHGAIRYRQFEATKPEEANAGVFVHAFVDTKKQVLAAELEETDEAGLRGEGANQDLVTGDKRQQEADKIIEIIQSTRQHKPDAKIAVLVRARNHLEVLVSEIRRHHPSLAFQAVEIEELADRQIVQDLLSLTYALHQRADRVHWLAMLRAPWCGLTLADLYALAGHDQHSTVLELMHNPSRLEAMSEDGRARLLHVREVAESALAHQGRMSVSRWLHGVWLMLGGASCLWDAADVRDVQAYFERVQSLEASGRFSPEQMAEEVKKLYAAPDAKAPDTLQFMTIHKSKGLEFDTVILPGLDRNIGGNEQSLMLWEELPAKNTTDDAGHETEEMQLVVAPYIPKGYVKDSKNKTPSPYDYLKMLEKERAAYEDARVLYVAATRAERCLHLLGVSTVDSKTGQPKAPKGSFLDMLWPIVFEDFAKALAAQSQLCVAQESVQSTDLAPAILLKDFVPQLIRLQQPQVPPMLQTIPLQITHNEARKKDGNDAKLQADIGTLTHFYLQMIAESALEAWPETRLPTLLPAMQRWFSQRGYEAQESEGAALKVQALLHTMLSSEQGRWVLQARPNAQCELAIEALGGDGVAKKIIDRTFVEDGVRWIIDYKTVAVSNADVAHLATLSEQYREQLEAYAALFAHEGLPINKAIFYVAIGQWFLLA